MNPKIAGIAGAALVILGTFCPIISAPIVGSHSAFGTGCGFGVPLVVLGAISMFLLHRDKVRAAAMVGVGMAGILGFFFFRALMLIDSMKQELPGMLTDAIQLQWGWPIMALGAGLLVTSAFVKATK
jgi:hypothetical protein